MAACAPALPKLLLRILGKDTVVSPNHGSGPPYNIKPASHGYQAFDTEHALIGMDDMHGGLPR